MDSDSLSTEVQKNNSNTSDASSEASNGLPVDGPPPAATGRNMDSSQCEHSSDEEAEEQPSSRPPPEGRDEDDHSAEMPASPLRKGMGPATGATQPPEGNEGEGKAEEGDSSSKHADTESQSKAKPLRAHDFKFGELLGEGSYSRVVRASRLDNGTVYAAKVMEKQLIVREKKQLYVKLERDVLNQVRHPFIVELVCTFQDHAYLYFILEFCPGGELFEVMKNLGTLSISYGTFVLAEILAALKHIHSHNVLHRDLKPENMLLSEAGHIKITDFGTAARVEPGTRRNTFCGTAEYVSPEVLQDKGASPASDLWAYGCVVFQAFAGRPPFRGASEYLTFQKILDMEYSFPDWFPEQAKDFVQSVLILEPTSRLGVQEDLSVDYDTLMSHPLFQGINFEGLPEQTPPKPTSLVDKSMIRKDSPAEDESLTLNESDFQKQEWTSTWSRFLEPGEKVEFCGLVIKKAGLFSNKRRLLILTSTPRLIYIDKEKMVMKGEIPWSDSLEPLQKNQKEFIVKTPNRTYYLEDIEGDSTVWVENILNAKQALSNS